MASFNLIIEPWLPCLFAGEELPREVSLRAALARAPDIAALAARSPLETAALHRLLLAILHRVFRPRTDDDWAGIRAAGHFDMGPIDAYLSAQASRFDLFDAERPFYQTPGLPESTATSIAKLGHEFCAGNNPALFDHSLDDAPRPLAPAAAARMLVAQQAFAIGGLIGRLPGDPPSAEAAHLVKAAVLLNTGDNLFETLLLNLLSQDALGWEADPASDLPAWEQPPPRAEQRDPNGYVDLLTWQSRRILLFPDAGGDTASRVSIMAGWRFPPSLNLRQRETMAAYVRRDSPARNQDPWAPVGFRPERALWRDSLALLQAVPDQRQPAAVIGFLGELQQGGHLESDRTFGLSTFGLSSDRAKVFLWRREDLPLPLAYLRNVDLVTALGRAIAAAEDAGQAVRRSTWALAEAVLAPGPDLKADRQRVSALAESLAAERTYWPALDVPFRRLMRDLADAFEDMDARVTVEGAWAESVQQAANRAFEGAARGVETSSRGYRAAAEVAPRFFAQLSKALAVFGRADAEQEETP